MGDEDAMSLADLTGDDRVSAGGTFIVVGHAADGAERGQVDFSGEAAGEAAGESVEMRAPPIPTGLVWPGTVIGAVDHGGQGLVGRIGL